MGFSTRTQSSVTVQFSRNFLVTRRISTATLISYQTSIFFATSFFKLDIPSCLLLLFNSDKKKYITLYLQMQSLFYEREKHAGITARPYPFRKSLACDSQAYTKNTFTP
jgi:hypothetical protein